MYVKSLCIHGVFATAIATFKIVTKSTTGPKKIYET